MEDRHREKVAPPSEADEAPERPDAHGSEREDEVEAHAFAFTKVVKDPNEEAQP